MKKILFILLSYFLLIFCLDAQDAKQISEIKVYKQFFRGGKLVWLLNAFKSPDEAGVDTTNIINTLNFDITLLKQYLNNNKRRKIPAIKFGNIDFAGELFSSDSKYYFFITSYGKNKLYIIKDGFESNDIENMYVIKFFKPFLSNN